MIRQIMSLVLLTFSLIVQGEAKGTHSLNTKSDLEIGWGGFEFGG